MAAEYLLLTSGDRLLLTSGDGLLLVSSSSTTEVGVLMWDDEILVWDTETLTWGVVWTIGVTVRDHTAITIREPSTSVTVREHAHLTFRENT